MSKLFQDVNKGLIDIEDKSNAFIFLSHLNKKRTKVKNKGMIINKKTAAFLRWPGMQKEVLYEPASFLVTAKCLRAN